MPDGLKYVLTAPGRQKFVTVLADEMPSIHTNEYIQELITNFTKDNDGSENKRKHKIHLVLYAFWTETFRFNPGMASVHDNFENPSLPLESLFKKLMDNLKTNSDVSSNILIIDDFSLFSLLSSNRDCSKVALFLRKCTNKFQRVFVFSNQQTLSPNEIATLYDVSSSVAVLGNYYGSSSHDLNHKIYICDLLKVKPERRVSHEQTRFQVTNGEINEVKDECHGTTSRNHDDVLKNLTTFKLTVEDSEKESRSRLYLPYFDAQKIAIEDPEDFDEYDEEDEEV